MRRRHRVGAIVSATALATMGLTGLAVGLAGAAHAHPLGNFTVNHYNGLVLHPDRIENMAVIDLAEIPMLQDRSTVDADGDGTVTDLDRARYAAATCRDFATAVRATVNGAAVVWQVTSSTFVYRPGTAGLDAGRTECLLTGPTDLRQDATVTFVDNYRADRIGWYEITASGRGVAIDAPTIAVASVTDELRAYPDDLLASPLDQRSAELRTSPGTGAGAAGAIAAVPLAGPVTGAIGALTTRFTDVVGSRNLTPLVGLLGICLALVLGAAHAALPGHGKTVMAAYIAGRRGTIRDAVLVGATVTATHTTGVLLCGLTLTLVAGFAGETLLGWLGVASGLLIAGIGVGLLWSTGPGRRWGNRLGHTHHDHTHHDHTHHDHTHHDGHPHHHGHAHHHGHPHHHGHAHGDTHGQPGRRGLVGLGIAGGLVPSPSALIVLLSAVALGRTWFGVLLVAAYGLGMAAMLTAAGLVLVHLRGQLADRVAHRLGHWPGRLSAAMPVLTATLVLAVGISLAVRGVLPLIGSAA